jgi:hypothetical protein
VAGEGLASATWAFVAGSAARLDVPMHDNLIRRLPALLAAMVAHDQGSGSPVAPMKRHS